MSSKPSHAITNLSYILHPKYATAVKNFENRRNNPVIEPWNSHVIKHITNYDFRADQLILNGITQIAGLEKAEKTKRPAQKQKTDESNTSVLLPVCNEILQPTKINTNPDAVDLNPQDIIIAKQNSKTKESISEFLAEFVHQDDPFSSVNMSAMNDLQELEDIFRGIQVDEPKINSEDQKKTVEIVEPVQSEGEDETNLPVVTNASDLLNLTQNAKNSSKQNNNNNYSNQTTSIMNQKMENTITQLPDFSMKPQGIRKNSADDRTTYAGKDLLTTSITRKISECSSYEDVDVVVQKEIERSEQSLNSNSDDTSWLKEYSGSEASIATNLLSMGYKKELIQAGLLVADIVIEFQNDKTAKKLQIQSEELNKISKKKSRKGFNLFGKSKSSHTSSNKSSGRASPKPNANHQKLQISDFLIIEILEYIELLNEKYSQTVDSAIRILILLNTNNKIGIFKMQKNIEHMGFNVNKDEVLGIIDKELKFVSSRSIDLVQSDGIGGGIIEKMDESRVLQGYVESRINNL